MLMYYDAIGTYLERLCLEPISFVLTQSSIYTPSPPLPPQKKGDTCFLIKADFIKQWLD